MLISFTPVAKQQGLCSLGRVGIFLGVGAGKGVGGLEGGNYITVNYSAGSANSEVAAKKKKKKTPLTTYMMMLVVG